MYRARSRQQLGGAGAFPASQQQPAARAQTPVELFVLALKHARATDVATTVNALYGKESFGAGSGGRTPTLGDELRGNQVPPVGTPVAQAVLGTGGRSASLSGEVVIVADSRANSLLVRANRTDFALIQSVVDQLDVRPLQVMIEVLIAEVRRNRGVTLGVEATLGTTDVGKTGSRIEGGLTSGPGLGDFALKVMRLGGLNIDATLRAATARGDVKILSRPVVFTTNNEEAEIIVGTQRPFVQLSRSLPTDAATRDQIVQYKEVGTKLRVRPTISVDGSVQLEVTQEVSGATNETAFNAPVISTRSVRTNLLIQDGRTVALGGLTDSQKEVLQGGIPVLSSIPILGGLFGHSSRNTDETELFIFLTPRVIRTEDDAARLSGALKERSEKHP
jgi:general secretion pathway protein D